MSQAVRIAIVGAGISGLAAAYFLRKESLRQGLEIDLSIIERSDRLGGVIRSETVEGFLLERGPENFVATRPGALQLIRELGLCHELIGSNDRLHRTFVVEQSRLRPLPEGIGFLVPVRFRPLWSTSLISAAGKFRALLEPCIGRSRGDLSVYSFLKRRVGRELTEKVAEPLLGAIYGTDIRKLSAVSALSHIYQMEQDFGSLWKGMRAHSKQYPLCSQPSFLTMRAGMSQLIGGLTEQLSGVSIHRNVVGTRIYPDSGFYRVKGTHFEGAFDLVILSTPAPAAAAVIDPANDAAAEVLRRIRYSAVTIVYLAYERAEFSHPLNGFGFVVPEKEATVIDACTWVSSKFEGRCPSDAVLLRCTVHDARRERPWILNEKEVAARVHKELQRILGISCQPIFSRVFRTQQAFPQPAVGHGQRLDQIGKALTRHPGLFLSGAFCGGAGIPSCIETAQEIAKRAIEFLKSS